MAIVLQIALFFFFLLNLIMNGFRLFISIDEYKKDKRRAAIEKRNPSWFDVFLFSSLTICFAGVLLVQLFTLGQGVPLSKNILVGLAGIFYIVNILVSLGSTLDRDMPWGIKIPLLLNVIIFFLLLNLLIIGNFVAKISF